MLYSIGRGAEPGARDAEAGVVLLDTIIHNSIYIYIHIYIYIYTYHGCTNLPDSYPNPLRLTERY